MSDIIKMYHAASIETIVKLKNKLNLLKSPVNILNKENIKELEDLHKQDKENIVKNLNAFESKDLNSNLQEYMPEYEKIKEEYQKRKKLVIFYIEKFNNLTLNNEIIKKTDNDMSSTNNIIDVEKLNTINVNNSNNLNNQNTVKRKTTLKKFFNKTASTPRKSKNFNDKNNTNFIIKNNIDQTQINVQSITNEEDLPEITNYFLDTIITSKQIEALIKTKKTLIDEKNYIAEIFILNPCDEKDKILIDFYMDIFKFSLKHSLSIEKISTLMSLMYFIFNYSIIGKKIMKQKSKMLFQKLLHYHSVNRPPYCYEIFNIQESILISNFIDNTFYRNYAFFENIFKYNVNIYLHSKEYKRFNNYNHKIVDLKKEDTVDDKNNIASNTEDIKNFIESLNINKLDFKYLVNSKKENDNIINLININSNNYKDYISIEKKDESFKNILNTKKDEKEHEYISRNETIISNNDCLNKNKNNNIKSTVKSELELYNKTMSDKFQYYKNTFYGNNSKNENNQLAENNNSIYNRYESIDINKDEIKEVNEILCNKINEVEYETNETINFYNNKLIKSTNIKVEELNNQKKKK